VRILYVAMKYDYGDPARGHGFEHYNFFDALHNMGHDILYFDFMSLLQQHGRAAMNARLREVAKAEKPDLLFCALFKEEIDRRSMREISYSGDTLTVNWFCDDHWRFDAFSCHWAPCFNWVVTTAASALPKYERCGINNVIKSQWACNHYLYRNLDLPLDHDVTFVGQPHGSRRATIATLRDAGIDVQTWGLGWENGRLSQEEMIRCFNRSRINLNLANASAARQPGPGARLRLAAKRGAARMMNLTPAGRALKERAKSVLAPHSSAELPTQNSKLKTQNSLLPEQIKGRNFEVPGCGGFLLTSPVEDLEQYYLPEREICLFHDDRELVEKIRYYLAREDDRAAIARAGYARTLREHTYVHRFTDIFRRLGFPADPPETVLARGPRPGGVEEVC
jgi:spore maturation protein CgeB